MEREENIGREDDWMGGEEEKNRRGRRIGEGNDWKIEQKKRRKKMEEEKNRGIEYV